jgi:sugar lactone lactonase YvrE
MGNSRRCRWLLLALTVACLLPIPAIAHPGSGIAVDRLGRVYFVDTGSGVWKLDSHGTLTRVPGPAFHWMAMDANGRFANASLPSGPGWEMAQAGANPTLLLSSDFSIAIGGDGNLYYPSSASGGVQIVRLTPSGQRSVLATLPPTARGPLRWVNGLAAGPDGFLYYTGDNMIGRISAQGQVTTVVANIALTGCASIPGMEADLGPYLRGLDVDARGTIYVAASGCGRLLKVTPQGQVSTVTQLESPWSPTGVAVSGSDLYVLEYLHTASDNRREWLPRIRKILPDGKVSIVGSILRR